MHLARTANSPGSYEAATPSGLGATVVTYSPMSSPALTIRSVDSSVLVLVKQYVVSWCCGWYYTYKSGDIGP